ncbi:MAG: Glutamate-tRNA ligase [Microgenomates group bacterium GW2011_GWF2_45_18]|nr:MAG: Glutamate-tRNA ligase [Microgenomates group bacterium GW2011_GWF1_44_10]KKU02105.1 MAG: Glutamate-tRNA ligase [Microgenomates group bacterium GW2011_GWF2_45_18]OGJ41392.1 MAG: glutamate--tRNA ligase [Candidatus Pacebacteria bacterium RIFOXYB1_FULL_44_10]HAU98658.1 glutamate--tRNA ligase [Candidatus Paceibacterota bacterium]HAX01916.1 glutamate--tRNA ligase [Candidatus Paceibacterota bacterium]
MSSFLTVRTRIAPSPTGIAHVGTAYIALFNYVFAKNHNGKFIIRIEDTDRGRFVEGAEQVIYDALTWLKIPHDEGVDLGGPFEPYRQSERLEIYHQHVETLLENGTAYYCFCSPEELQAMRAEQQKQKQLPMYDGRCSHIPYAEAKKRAKHEKHVVRLRMPDSGKAEWEDAIRGHVSFEYALIDDQVLLKSDGFPTYHFAVVVDDHMMQISHVIRGEEWISSTPKHLFLYEAFGWETPTFAHMPLLRNADHSKLSKRKNDVSLISYMNKGYIPEALINFLCLMGWSHPEGKDIFNLDEFRRVFTIDRMQTTGPIFDLNKLAWMNGIYIREKLTQDQLIEALQPFTPTDFPMDLMGKILPLVRERLVLLSDLESLTDFFYRDISVNPAELLKKSEAGVVTEQLTRTIAELEQLSQWSVAELETCLRSLQEKYDWKKSQYFMMIRVAVTGKTATPPLFETMEVLGREKTIERLREAKEKI